jgi:hypothetical protein
MRPPSPLIPPLKPAQLKVFHEYAGPVFPPRLTIQLPSSLPNPLQDGPN